MCAGRPEQPKQLPMAAARSAARLPPDSAARPVRALGSERPPPELWEVSSALWRAPGANSSASVFGRSHSRAVCRRTSTLSSARAARPEPSSRPSQLQVGLGSLAACV